MLMTTCARCGKKKPVNTSVNVIRIDIDYTIESVEIKTVQIFITVNSGSLWEVFVKLKLKD